MIGAVIRQRYETETPMFIGVGAGTLKPVENLVADTSSPPQPSYRVRVRGKESSEGVSVCR